MIRALIVDDAPLAREGIRVRLVDEGDVEIVGEAGDGPEAVAAISTLLPDLIFLDVQLPGFDGFEVLERASHVHIPTVIFVTAFDSYAVKAFETHALDYLLKPVTNRRFREALQRARHCLTREEDVEQARRRVAELVRSHARAPARPSNEATQARPVDLLRLAVKDRDRFVLLKTDELDWIEAAGDYVRLHAHGRSFLIRMTMGDLEEKLDSRHFVRVHRSTFVNLDRVREIKPHSHGDFDVLLRDGTVLRMSRGYRDRLLLP